MKKTLKEIALEMGFKPSQLEREGWLELDEKYAIFQDEKGLHLTDLMSWARFSPRIIGKKSNVTQAGVAFQVNQLKKWKIQTGEIKVSA